MHLNPLITLHSCGRKADGEEKADRGVRIYLCLLSNSDDVPFTVNNAVLAPASEVRRRFMNRVE